MKFQPIFKFWAIALFSLLFVTACNDDDDPTPDTAAPTISVNEPTEGASVATGGQLTLNATVSDDSKVSEVQVVIHDSFDGHGHSDKTSATRWNWSEVYTADSKDFTLTDVVDVPADAATGPYHVVINALDESGNSAQLVEVNFEITGSSQPTVTNLEVNGNAPSGEIHEHFDDGATSVDYTLAFQANDPDGLEHIDMELKHHGDDHDHGGDDHDHDHDGDDHDHDGDDHDEEPYWDKHMEASGQLSLDVNETIPFVKADMEDGEYELRILVEDKNGNVVVETVDFHVGDH